MGYGDEILAAGQAQRIYDRVGSPVWILDINRRPRWHPIWDGNPAIRAPHDITNVGSVPSIISAPHARPYIVYPFTVDTGWTFSRSFKAREHIAKIYLTAEEIAYGRALRDTFGPFVLIDPWSKHENLRWPIERWHRLVASRPTIQFVQHVWDTKGPLVEGAAIVQTPSFRSACGVLAASSLYVRGESGMCHAAAALDIPNVAIWGGCMSWEALGGYPKQLGLGIEDLPCGSWRPCAHCALAMANISVEDVARAIDIQLECYGVR